MIINCPWHEEKTPSCLIRDDGMVLCLGCGMRATGLELAQATAKKAARSTHGTEDR